MLSTLPGVTAGLGVTAGAHHRYSDRSQGIAQRRALTRAEHDADLRERNAQRARQLHKSAVGHREKGTKSAGPRRKTGESHTDLALPTVFEKIFQMCGERDRFVLPAR